DQAPGIPRPPAPGGVEEEQIQRPGTPIRYGSNVKPPRINDCKPVIDPPAISPPTRFGFHCSNAAGSQIFLSKTVAPKPGANRSNCPAIASATYSRSEAAGRYPLGTCVYVHSTCLPSGAREGSATCGWVTITNGRSGIRPALTWASASRISAARPPTCTVVAEATRSSAQGTGP